MPASGRSFLIYTSQEVLWARMLMLASGLSPSRIALVSCAVNVPRSARDVRTKYQLQGRKSDMDRVTHPSL